MAGSPRLVRVNSIAFSWTSSSFKADNFPIAGIVKVDYAEKLDQEDVYANQKSGLPVAYTAGKYSVDGFTISQLKEDGATLLQYLAAKSGVGAYGRAQWTFTAQCSEPWTPGQLPITTVASTCRIVGKKDTYDEGMGKLVTEFTIKSLQIVENGITLFDASRDLENGPGY